MMGQDRDAVDLAGAFKALGDPTRLSIFEFLCECCCDIAVDEAGDVSRTEGPTAGEVCCRVTGADKITSTVSFHLKELRNASLVSMEKRGKSMVCSVNRETLDAMRAYWNRIGLSVKTGCCEKE